MQRRFALLLVLATAATLLGHLQPSARASRAVAYIPEPIPALAPDNVAQIFFMGPAGMRVRWDITAPGQYDSEPLVCPGRYNFPLGAIYRLMLYDIPGQANLVIYSDLEIAPPLPRTIEYLESNAVPVLLHDYDFVHAAAGEYLTKVIYVPDREMALESAQQGVETLTSTRLEAGLDPIVEADRRGAILAIVRIGAGPGALPLLLKLDASPTPPWWPATPAQSAAGYRR